MAIMERFGECALGSVHERLSTIKQRSTIKEYILDFDLLLAQAKGTPEHIMLGYFLNRLRKPIRDIRDIVALREFESHNPGRQRRH